MTADLMERWLKGYCLARAMPAPEAISDGFWIEVAVSQQAGRYILPRFDPVTIARLIEKTVEPSTYIEFPGSKTHSLPLLPHGWAIRDDAYLMKSPLVPVGGSPGVEGYVFIEEPNEHGLLVTVRSEAGDLAARGCYASFAGHAVFDQIATEPNHQRRGLGAAVMARLSDHAVGHGFGQGVLVATEEGRRLYVTLGWIEVSPIVSMISGGARSPESK